jgi:hypothetical protein
VPHIEYFVVSESISVDQDRNTVSLFHIIEEYIFSKFPGRIPRLVISALWDIGDDEHDQEFKGFIRLSPPSPGESRDCPFSFRTEHPVPRQRVFLEMKNLEVPGAGEYQFEVFLDEHHYASHKILILEKERPPEESRLDSGSQAILGTETK